MSSSFTEEEISAFVTEAEELLDSAEKGLLLLDKGEVLATQYDLVFRAFHNIKGAAGMMEMTALQSHMHQLETIFTDHKADEYLEKPLVDLFLRGLDGTRRLLRGESIDFDYSAGSPAATAPTPPPAIVEESKGPAVVPPIGKILVVDDEPEIVELLADILRAENIEVETVTDPRLVMDTITRFKPDVLFTDISMPEISGLDLLRMVAKSHPDMPVVFISGFVSKEILLESIHLGVFAVLEKPFEVVRIMETSFNAIEKVKLARMVNTSINLLMFQFSDLSDYLKSQGKEDLHKSISEDIASLLEQRRAIRKRRQP
jgi:CheY-like chemotaxis protein/HPt (histidine-containing phosphotransfer) domain-containing protein